MLVKYEAPLICLQIYSCLHFSVTLFYFYSYLIKKLIVIMGLNTSTISRHYVHWVQEVKFR